MDLFCLYVEVAGTQTIPDFFFEARWTDMPRMNPRIQSDFGLPRDKTVWSAPMGKLSTLVKQLDCAGDVPTLHVKFRLQKQDSKDAET